MRWIPPGIQQMPAHHTQHHHHHHHHLYNIDPGAGELIPPKNPTTPAPAAPPRAESGAGADGLGGGGAGRGIGPQAQGQREEPARGAEGARPWDGDRGTVGDPLGDEALPLVGEV